ncbi:hypothetical protein BSKO_06859 [Bryopsis sp. KO-2023]|nr:hypothetical protein BSKO_06859 [Bryopsis sp. KO-2023]
MTITAGPVEEPANRVNGNAVPLAKPDVEGHSNVYVKNIPEEVDESTLQAIFQPFGVIDCCRVQRNPRNTTGLTFGFVKFRSVEQARASIQGMNGAIVGNSTLEVKFADQDPTEKAFNGKTPSDNLYVRNLPNTFDDRQLRMLFSSYGAVIDCRILHNGEGQRGAGALVRMGSVDESTRAISALNGQRPQGGTDILLVRYADTEEEKAKRKDRKTVAGTAGRFSPYSLTKPQPIPLNGVSGAVPQPAYPGVPPPFNPWPNPMPEPVPGAGAGFPPSVPSAYPPPGVQPYDQSGLLGYAPPPSLQPASIYIKNLPSDAGKLFLYEKFAPFGAILSVKALEDDKGQCRGVGFVNYGDNSAAVRAVQSLNGAKIGERNLHVSLQTHRVPRQ